MIEEHQLRQKRDHDRQAKLRTFELGDKVYVRNFRSKGPRWVSGGDQGTKGTSIIYGFGGGKVIVEKTC